MARPASKYPTELELEILKILWKDGAEGVREVRDGLTDFRDLAYTSVMTIMNVMTKKGYLSREKDGGRYVYAPCLQQGSISQDMMSDLVRRLFDGSAAAAMLNLMETSDIDEIELCALRNLIDDKMKGYVS